MSEPDRGSVEISAKVDKSGISVGARSRAVAAIDRLIGNVAEIPATYLDGIAQRQAARNRVREKLIEAAGNLAVGEIEHDKEIARMFVDKIIRQDIRRLENKEAVAEKAMDALEHSQIEDVNEPQQGFDPDWLNQFELFAEQATSDSLREIWAQVLAGKIRKPSSFSRSTIRAIAELDFEIAKKFEAALQYRYSDTFLFRPKELKGDQLIDFAFLEEEGFLQSIDGFLGMDMNADVNGGFNLVCGDLMLRCVTKPNQKIRATLIRITRTGQEIASILPKADYWHGLREFGEIISDLCTSVQLAKVLEMFPDKQVRYEIIATIKAAS